MKALRLAAAACALLSCAAAARAQEGDGPSTAELAAQRAPSRPGSPQAACEDPDYLPNLASPGADYGGDADCFNGHAPFRARLTRAEYTVSDEESGRLYQLSTQICAEAKNAPEKPRWMFVHKPRYTLQGEDVQVKTKATPLVAKPREVLEVVCRHRRAELEAAAEKQRPKPRPAAASADDAPAEDPCRALCQRKTAACEQQSWNVGLAASVIELCTQRTNEVEAARCTCDPR